MGFDLEKRLALKQLAAELEKRLLDSEVGEPVTPGRRTRVDDVVTSALRKFDTITQHAKRGFQAVPWQQQRTTFDDYRATALREVLTSLDPGTLRSATVASADPTIAARATEGGKQKATRPNAAGQAMWRAAERRAGTLYRHAMDAGEVPGEDPILDEALARCGSGAPLPLAVRKQMEDELGMSLARVRIHTDRVAAEAAKAVRADAFTVGEDIFFSENAFSPESRDGKKLLAHELTHVVQAYQGRTATGGTGIKVSQPGESLEREADAFAERMDKRSQPRHRGDSAARAGHGSAVPQARGSFALANGSGPIQVAPTIAPVVPRGSTLLRRPAQDAGTAARRQEAPVGGTTDPNQRGKQPVRQLVRDREKERTGRGGGRGAELVRGKGAELSSAVTKATEGSIKQLKRTQSTVRQQGTGKQAKALKKDQARLGKVHERDAKKLKKQAENTKAKKESKGGPAPERKQAKGESGPIKFKTVGDWNAYLPPALPDQDQREKSRVLALVQKQMKLDRQESATMLNGLRTAQLAQARQVRGMIPGLVGQVRAGEAAAIGRVHGAEASQSAAVQAAVAGQQASVRAAAATALAAINGAHRTAMTTIRTAKQDAFTKLTEAKTQALGDIDAAETMQIAICNLQYMICRVGFMGVGSEAAGACAARGGSHPFPNTFDGDKREAARGAAKDVASAYAEGMPAEALKSYNENIAPNKPEAITSIRQMATDQRKQVRDSFTQSRKAVEDAARAATTAANEMKSGAVSQVSSTSSSTSAQLAALGAQSIAGIRQQAAGARSGIKKASSAAIAAVTTGCNKAAQGFEDGAQGLVVGAKKLENPNPQETKQRVDDGMQKLQQAGASLKQSMGKQASGAGQGMSAQAQGAASGIAQAASGAKQSATQMGAGARQGITQIGQQTSTGLQGLADNFKTNADTTGAAGVAAMKSSSKALTDAYVEVTNTTRDGLEGAVDNCRTSFAGVVSAQEDPAIVKNAQAAADAVKPFWQQALAFVVSIVVAIVVVVVVTALIVTTGPVGAILVGAAAGALGSVLGSMASNLVLGNGVMDGITWKTVAMGAVGGALGAGFTQAISAGVGRFGSAGLQSMTRGGHGVGGLALRTGIDTANEMATDAVTQLVFTGGYKFDMTNLVATLATSGVTSTAAYDGVQTRVQGGIQGKLGHVELGTVGGSGLNLTPTRVEAGKGQSQGSNTGTDRVEDVGDGRPTSAGAQPNAAGGKPGGSPSAPRGAGDTSTAGNTSSPRGGDTAPGGGQPRGGDTTAAGGGQPKGGGDAPSTTKGAGDTTSTTKGAGDTTKGGDTTNTPKGGGDTNTDTQTTRGGDTDTTRAPGDTNTDTDTTRAPGDKNTNTDADTTRAPGDKTTRAGADTDADGPTQRAGGDKDGPTKRGGEADEQSTRSRGGDRDTGNDSNRGDQDTSNGDQDASPNDGPESASAGELADLGYPNATRPKANEAAQAIESGTKPKPDSIRETQANQRGLQDLQRIGGDPKLKPESRENIRRDVAGQMRAAEPSGNLHRDVSQARTREQARVEAERAAKPKQDDQQPGQDPQQQAGNDKPTDSAGSSTTSSTDSTTPKSDATSADSTTSPDNSVGPKPEQQPSGLPGDERPTVQPANRPPATPVHPGGLADATVRSGFESGMRRVRRDWAHLSSDQRMTALADVINTNLVAAGFPPVDVTHFDMSEAGHGGVFDQSTWKIAISTSELRPDVNLDGMTDLIVHEARHAEQAYLMARYQLEIDPSGASAVRLGLPPHIIARASTESPMSPELRAAAKQYSDLMHPDGARFAERQQMMGDLVPSRVAVEAARANMLRVLNDPTATEAQRTAAEDAYTEALNNNQQHEDWYHNSANERDAYAAGDPSKPRTELGSDPIGRIRAVFDRIFRRRAVIPSDSQILDAELAAARAALRADPTPENAATLRAAFEARQQLNLDPRFRSTPVVAPNPATSTNPTSGVPRQSSTNLDELYAQAEVAHRELRSITNDVAGELGGRPLVPDSLKGRERTEQKIRDDYGGDASRITDLARSTVEFKNAQDIQRAVNLLRSRGEIVRIKDRFASPVDGYRDVMINMRMSNGHVVEIQLHLDAILQVKNQGRGHDLYNEIRVLTPEALGRQLTPDEQAHRKSLIEEMTALYDSAYAGAGGADTAAAATTPSSPTNPREPTTPQSGITPDGAAPRPPAPDSLQALLDNNVETIDAIKGDPYKLTSTARQLLKMRGLDNPTEAQITTTKYELNKAIESGNYADFRAPIEGKALNAADGVNDRLGNIFHEKHVFGPDELTNDALRMTPDEQTRLSADFESGMAGMIKAATFINTSSRSEGDFSHAYGKDAWRGFVQADTFLNNIPKGALLETLTVDTLIEVNRLIHTPDTGLKSKLLRFLAMIGRGGRWDTGGELRTGRQFARPEQYSAQEIANLNEAGVGTRIVGGKDAEGGGKAMLNYPSPDQVRPGLDRILSKLKADLAKSDADPIGAAAEFQRKFVALHPFGDSNGRTGRAIMNRILAEYDFPPAILADQNADISLTPEQWRTEVARGVGRSKKFLDGPQLHSKDSYLSRVGIRAVDVSPNKPITLDGKPFDLGTDGLLYDPTGRPWIVKNGEVIPMGQLEHMFMSRRIIQSAEYKPADGSDVTQQDGIDAASDRLRALTSETRAFYDQVAADSEAGKNVVVRDDTASRGADATYKLAPEPEVAQMLTMLTDVSALDPAKIFAVQGQRGTESSSTISKHQQMDLEFWYIEKGLRDVGNKDLAAQVRANRAKLHEMARARLLSHTDPTRVSPDNPKGFRYRYEKMMYDLSPLGFESFDVAVKKMGDKQTTIWRGDYSFARLIGMAPNNDIRQPDAKKVARGRTSRNQLTNLIDDLIKLEGSAVGRQYISTTSDLALLAGGMFAKSTNAQEVKLGGLPGPASALVMKWISKNRDMTPEQRKAQREIAEKAGDSVLPLSNGAEGMELRDAFGIPGRIVIVEIVSVDSARIRITANRKAFQLGVDKDSLLPGIYALGGPIFVNEQELHGLEQIRPWQIKRAHDADAITKEFPIVGGKDKDKNGDSDTSSGSETKNAPASYYEPGYDATDPPLEE